MGFSFNIIECQALARQWVLCCGFIFLFLHSSEDTGLLKFCSKNSKCQCKLQKQASQTQLEHCACSYC